MNPHQYHPQCLARLRTDALVRRNYPRFQRVLATVLQQSTSDTAAGGPKADYPMGGGIGSDAQDEYPMGGGIGSEPEDS